MSKESLNELIIKAAAITAAGTLALGMSGCRSGEAHGAELPAPKHTVADGETLTHIAEDTRQPDETISDQVIDIQLANKLSTARISEGQVLVIPR